ncbi:MAG: hypothetical protein Q8M99_11925 [Methylotenera sp.]|nr:hypothetical protein [Methylotenera sp.]
MRYYLLWLVYFIPAILVELFCFITNPIACMFVRKEPRHDIVKRLGKKYYTFDREYLWGIFYLWQTHDNAVDEGWWGLYDIAFIRSKTQADYDNSQLIRYWCRVWWLSRNTAYGWHYLLFSVHLDKGWQVKKDIPLLFGYYNSVNIGWKSHKGKPRLLYANRIIGIRKNK